MFNFKKCQIVLFLIALLNIQYSTSIEIVTLKQLKLPHTESFHDMCYYSLKTDLIIRNYVTKIKEIVNIIFETNKVTTRTVDFALFSQIFSTGHYGEIAREFGGSEDYIKSYWNYFKVGKGTEMNEEDFTRFMGIYYLEGELLVAELHPTLSDFFPNEHNLKKKIGCNVALAFWELTDDNLRKIFINFKWSLKMGFITKSELFQIYITTHSGKCLIIQRQNCNFFNKKMSAGMGFFNLSGGKRKYLTTTEAKFAYATYLFDDIYMPECKRTKFDEKEILKLIKKINIPKN